MKVYKVKSDNFEGLITKDAYKELTLQMSTGDFHAHTKRIVEVEDWENVTTIEDLFENDESYIGQFSTLEELGQYLFEENAANWDLSDWIKNSLDYERYAQELIKSQEIVEYKGHWFFNN